MIGSLVKKRKSKRRRVRSDQNSNAIDSLPPNLLADVLVSDDHSSVTGNAAAQSSTAVYSLFQRQDAVSMSSAAVSATVSRPSYTTVVQSQPQPQPQRV